jgi:hypothetical protein
MTPEQKWVIVACVVALVLILNASAFVLFMLDKYLAEERRRRIPETVQFRAILCRKPAFSDKLGRNASRTSGG